LLIIAAVIAAILFMPLALRKNAAILGVSGGRKIVAARSFIPKWNNDGVDVYVGEEKVFRLQEDWPDASEFIYPFPDGRRFFCDYFADTAMLDFVVDLDARTSVVANWPTDYELRNRLEDRAKEIVGHTKGVVRMPSDEELEEVRSYLARTSTNQIKATSLPFCDLGIRRFYAEQDHLLLDLATNRQHYWPLPGAP